MGVARYDLRLISTHITGFNSECCVEKRLQTHNKFLLPDNVSVFNLKTKNDSALMSCDLSGLFLEKMEVILRVQDRYPQKLINGPVPHP
ncbi:hypothetical protein NPIL_184681 [Nephila pilipes]|uniref:Uncharacterized protein n=1 Tax=Nephila pilipes TaxID=299642 RepID=A0A8X6PA59_NEPPI|nr:hypothetical protein NPIL_184681 [Nephila pilipes]